MMSFKVDGSTILPPSIEEEVRRIISFPVPVLGKNGWKPPPRSGSCGRGSGGHRRRRKMHQPPLCLHLHPRIHTTSTPSHITLPLLTLPPAATAPCFLRSAFASAPPQVLAEAKKSKYTTVRVLAAAKNIIEGYYQERGLTFGTISHFDGMETGQVIAYIIEGEITRVNLVYVDKEGGTSPFGSTNQRVITRELPFKAGELYNVEDAKKALRDIFQLQLFDNVQVVPKPDDEDPQKVEVDIVLKERPLKTAEVELEWGIAPGEGGRPDLVSVKPGGSVFFEHRNLDGEARQLFGSVSTANFLAPQDDLGFKVEYVRPYCWGDKDPQRTNFKASAFNSRKLSPVFVGGPLSDEVPGVWVDRAGVKASFTETYSRQSKCQFGAVLEEVTTRDESGGVCTAGSKALPSGMLATDGPPTTLSGTGTDRILFLQVSPLGQPRTVAGLIDVCKLRFRARRAATPRLA